MLEALLRSSTLTLASPASWETCQSLQITLVCVTDWSVGVLVLVISMKGIFHSPNFNEVKLNTFPDIQYPSDRSCLQFEANGTFSYSAVTLLQKRWYHLCWPLPTGEVLLMGGEYSANTTERVSANVSSSSADFNLAYDTV